MELQAFIKVYTALLLTLYVCPLTYIQCKLTHDDIGSKGEIVNVLREGSRGTVVPPRVIVEVTLPNVVAKIEAEIKVVLDGSAEDVLILLALIAKDAVVVADLVFVPLWLGCEREALVDSA
jgi:hypothetical protein